jgi:tetratricopeptide (TPR) repeat protein
MLSLAVLAWAAVAVPAPAAPPTAEQIARWVRDLGADDFAMRQQATDALWKAGEVAERALEEAAKSGDAEVAHRAREILDKFRTGIYPDTPPAVVTLVRQYQATDPNQRQGLIQAFCKQGRAGLTAVRKLINLEQNAELRKTQATALATSSGQAAGVMLAEGDAAGAEEVLEATLSPEQPETLRSYAAYYLLRGTLDDKARQLRARVATAGDKRAAAILAYLYRAKGDLEAARWAAERAADSSLLEGILTEQGDWKAVLPLLAAKKGPPLPEPQARNAAAVRATYLRLAGDLSAEAELRKVTAGDDFAAASVLLANDRPADAIALFQRGKNWTSAFEFLAFQLRYREAFDLVDKADLDKAEARLAVKVRRARVLGALGEKEKARQEFARLTDELKGGEESGQYGELLKAQCALGLKDEAYAQAVRILALPQSERFSSYVFDGLFGDQSGAAAQWWVFLRVKFPGEEPAATLKRLRSLFDDHKPGADFETLAGAAADHLAKLAHDRDQSAGNDQYQRELATLADVCLAAGKPALAQAYLEQAAALPGDGSPLQRLADFLADRGRWAEAAERYGQAWERDRSKPLPLYLRGWALGKAGRAREGQPFMDRAHLLALADENARYELAEGLGKHGLAEAATREYELLARTAEFNSVYMANALADLVGPAVRQKDYFRAANYYQRIGIGVLEAGSAFLENEAYLSVPHAVHLNRARGLVAIRKFREARAEIDTCVTLLPGDVELPLSLVPELAKHGQKGEAADLYNRVVAVHEKVLAEYPRCSASHNQLAWLAARCRRDLDRALEHARKAVELEPRQASYLDTLAEVYFQRGDRDRALELMKKCLEMEPKKDFYRQQLRRYEAGDPAAEVPAEG